MTQNGRVWCHICVLSGRGGDLEPGGRESENALYAAKHLKAIRRQGYTTFGFFQLSEQTKPMLEILAQGPMKKD